MAKVVDSVGKSCSASLGDLMTPAIAEAIKTGKSELIAAAVNLRIKELKGLVAKTNKASKKAVTAFELQGIASTRAAYFTSRDDSDHTNELNTFTPTGYKAAAANIVQRVGSIVGAMAHQLFGEKDITKDETKLFNDFVQDFGPKFAEAFEAIYKDDTNYAYRYRDMLQYFPDREQAEYQYSNPDTKPFVYINSKGEEVHSKLDHAIVEAIASAAYEWLGTDARTAIGDQNTQGMHYILDLDSKQKLPSEAAKYLQGVGNSATAVASQIGRIAVPRTNLIPTGATQYAGEERLQISMGFMALATMEKMRVLERQELYTGKVNPLEVGETLMTEVRAIKANKKLTAEAQEAAIKKVLDAHFAKLTKQAKTSKAAITKGERADVLTIIDSQRAVLERAIAQEDELGDLGRKIGLDGLKEGNVLKRNQVFHVEAYMSDEAKANEADDNKLMQRVGLPYLDPRRRMGSTVVYFKVAKEGNWLKKYTRLMNKAPDGFGKLFGVDAPTRGISFEKIKHPKKFRVGRTGSIFASDEHAQNLKNYIDTPWVASMRTMDIFNAFNLKVEGGIGASQLGRIIGMVPDFNDNLEIRDPNIDGVNVGILSQFEGVQTWLELAKEQLAEGKSLEEVEFYINSRFQSNDRMLQTGIINPQNYKMHRHLFTPKGWRVQFDPTTDEDMRTAFLEGIAQAFDIESGKVDGAENQVRLVLEALEQPKVKAALKAIRAFHKNDGDTFTEAQEKKIADAVELIGTKTLALKALVEYARFQDHQGGLFETDMYKEVDGVSNGVIIGVLQLIPDSADKQALLAQLALGGINVGPLDQNLDKLLGEHNLHDAYERMGQSWAKNLYERREKLFQTMNDKAASDKERKNAEHQYNKIVALGEILGTFVNEKGEDVGVLTKTVRKLSKYRTMQSSVYGSGAKRQIGILTEDDVINDGIYVQIEEILKEVNAVYANPRIFDTTRHTQLTKLTKKLEKHLDNVARIANYETVDKDGKLKKGRLDRYTDENGLVDPDKLRTFKLTEYELKSVRMSVNINYGSTMKAAIKEVYGSIAEARDPLNATVQIGITTYNAILERKVQTQLEIDANALQVKYAEENAKDKEDNKALIAKGEKPKPVRWDRYVKLNKEAQRAFALDNAQQEFSRDSLNKILDEVKYLLPKIKTPLWKEGDEDWLSLAKRADKNNKQGKRAKSFKESLEVKQDYAGDVIARLSAKADGIPFQVDPGVSAMVKAIQMIDGMVANHLMSVPGLQFLNNHDGFSHSIKDSAKLAKAANKMFYDIMRNYHLGEQFADIHNRNHNENKAKGYIPDMKAAGVPLDTFLGDLIADGAINGNAYAKLFNLEPDNVNGQIGNEADRLAKAAGLNPKFDSGQFWPEASATVLGDLYGKELLSMGEALSEPEYDAQLEELTRAVLDDIGAKANHMAEQTKRNKIHIAKNTRSVTNYSHNGTGYEVEQKNADGTVTVKPEEDRVVMFPNDTEKGMVDVNDILNSDRESSDNSAQTIAGYIASTIKSKGKPYVVGSSDAKVDVDVNNYPEGAQQINSQNVSQVFDSVVAVDEEYADNSQVSPEHKQHLKHILDDIVSHIMTPISLYVQHRVLGHRENQGAWVYDPETGNRRIFLQTQRRSDHPDSGMLGWGIQMSGGETYAHEFVHHISGVGLMKDPSLRRQANALYDQTRDHFEELYGETAWRIFLDNPDSFDTANPNDIIDARNRWDYLFKPKQDAATRAHNGLDEFIAYGLTNENFRKALSEIVISDSTLKMRGVLKGIIEKNIQTTLVNLFQRIMDILHQTLSHQKHSPTIDTELENLVLALGQVEARSKNALYQGLIDLENKATDFGINMDEKIKATVVKTMSNRRLGRMIKNAKELPEIDNMLGHQMRVFLNWYTNDEAGLIASMATEMQSTTERFKDLHKLQRKRGRVIDAAKQDAAKRMREAVLSFFDKKPPTKAEGIHITQVLLKGDMEALLSAGISLKGIQSYIQDSEARDGQIERLLDELRADPILKQHAQFFDNAADDLGFFMQHTQSRENGEVLMNAYNIANLPMTSNEGSLQKKPAVFEKAVNIIDQLASLHSLKYLDHNAAYSVGQLMEENMEAMEAVMTFHGKLKKQAFEELFNSKPTLMEKGYIESITNGRVKYEQGTKDDIARFEAAGYTWQRTPIKRDPKDPIQEDIYMFKSKLGTINDLLSGITSYSQNTHKGAGQVKLQRQIGNAWNEASKEGELNNQRMLNVTRQNIKRMYNPRPNGPGKTTENYMIPQFDVNGDIVAKRYMMSNHTKTTVLEQTLDFDAVLAAMSTTIIDKKYSPQINSELIKELKVMFDHDIYGFAQVPEAYVEISANSKNERHKAIWAMLPPKMKMEIKTSWGMDKLYVPQDVVDLAFGQRKYSIVEMFGKDAATRTKFERTMISVLTFALDKDNPFTSAPKKRDLNKDQREGRIVERAKTIEDLLIQTTSLAKNNIVVRNLGVTAGNYASNMAYLKSKGIGLNYISEKSKEAITSAYKYQNDMARLNAAKDRRFVVQSRREMSVAAKLKETKKLDAIILRLENEIALNPSTAMIAAGLMPSIVDDIDTANVQSNYKFGVDAWIDKQLGRVPDKAESIARTLFMTEDTEGYKTLNNAVKMTDYVARYVLYHHYTKTGQGSARIKMNHDDAISAVSDEFINFDIPTHRTLEYLNSIGILWFSKYQLRVLKHIKNIMVDHPFTGLMTFIASAYLGGNNIINSIPGVTKDMLQVFGNPFSALMDSADQILYVNVATSPFKG